MHVYMSAGQVVEGAAGVAIAGMAKLSSGMQGTNRHLFLSQPREHAC